MSVATPKVEAAFGDGFGTPIASMSWTDVSSSVLTQDGVNVGFGRRDERSVADANSLSLTLRNDAGDFTPLKTGGTYYPDVKVDTPVKVSCVYPVETEGNYVSNSTFESGITGWSGGGSVPPTLTQSSTFAFSGTFSLRVAWGTGGVLPLAQSTVTGLTIGRTYTASMRVRVPTGDPNVLVAVGGGGGVGTATAVKDAWVRISHTWTASSTSHAVQVWPATAPVAGDFVYVDEVQVNEGSSAATFTTATPTRYTRFLGFADMWAVQWPLSTDNHATCGLAASSRLARLGSLAQLRSLSQQTLLADDPVLFWPLDESEGATEGASIGSSAIRLKRTTVGGTTPTWGNENGPPFEDATAVLCKASLTSSTAASGGRLRTVDPVAWASSFTLEGLFWTSFAGTAPSASVILFNGSGPADGVLVTLYYNVGNPYVVFNATDSGGDDVQVSSFSSGINIADGQVHHVAFTINGTTLEGFLDGVSVGTNTDAAYGGLVPSDLIVAKVTDDQAGRCAVSNVAYYNTALSSTRIAEHASAALTAYLNETPAARLEKYAAFAGVAATELDLETGQLLNLANIPAAGTSAVDLMRTVETAESGVLFDAADGILTFHDRAHRYGATATAIPAGAGGLVQADFAPVLDRSTLINDAQGSNLDGTIVERVVDTASQTAYGPATATVNLATDSAVEVQAWAAWQVDNYAEPANRAPTLTVDLAAATPEQQAAIMALTVGSKVTVTGLPTQAEATSLSFFVEGYAEQITATNHRITFNVSPSAPWENVLILDDATFGLPDGVNRIAL